MSPGLRDARVALQTQGVSTNLQSISEHQRCLGVHGYGIAGRTPNVGVEYLFIVYQLKHQECSRVEGNRL